MCLLASMFVAACGKKPPIVEPQIVKVVETVEVMVPVAVRPVPPAELLEPLKFILPVFVAPSDPSASSALTAEGERLLRGLVEELIAHLEAWKAWAKKD